MTYAGLDRVRVLLVDDHPIVRSGLRLVIEQDERLLIVGEGESGQDAIRLARDTHPDVIVMDISMPEMNGLEATRLAKDVLPGVRVLIVSTHSDDEYVMGALMAGADGYLLKQCHPRDLCAGIHRVHAGERVVHHSLVHALIGQAIHRATEPPRDALSERERGVLQLLAEGSTSKEIALALGLRPKTVENHRARILDKLGVANSVAAVRTALSQGLVSVPNGSRPGHEPAFISAGLALRAQA
jgi:DNA-binding NarL/FixJ family response regulator